MFGATGGSSPDPSKLPPSAHMLEYVQQLKEQLKEQELLTPEIEGWNPEQYSRRIVAQGINWLVSLRRNTTSAGPPPWQQVPERPAQTPGEAAAQELADTKDQLAQEKAARLAAEKERDKAHDARADAEAERKQEHDARIAAETERDQERDARADAEERIQNLRGATKRARQEERDKAKSQISGLRQDLENARTQYKRSQEKLRADNETLQKQLAAATPEVMKDAWRHIHNGEPISAYKEAMAIFEEELYQSIKVNLNVPDNKPKMYVLLDTAVKEGYINEKQFNHLGLMWDRRNDLAHRPEEKIRKSKNPLTESEARAAVAYLGQVIDQLDSS